MSFILGFLTGILFAFGLMGFLTYWLCNRSNNIAVAKFINGIAQALAHRVRVEKTKNNEVSDDGGGETGED
jgi:hypothetical protein